MQKKPVSKGNANKETLGDRLKAYENVQTERMLIARLPTYVRIDGRAFHSFCRGLTKPFDRDFAEIMKKTCAYLVEETNAICGYVQSDEISLAYESPEKNAVRMPDIQNRIVIRRDGDIGVYVVRSRN